MHRAKYEKQNGQASNPSGQELHLVNSPLNDTDHKPVTADLETSSVIHSDRFLNLYSVRLSVSSPPRLESLGNGCASVLGSVWTTAALNVCEQEMSLCL